LSRSTVGQNIENVAKIQTLGQCDKNGYIGVFDFADYEFDMKTENSKWRTKS